MNVWEILLSATFTIALISFFVYLTLRFIVNIHAILSSYRFEVQTKIAEMKAKKEFTEKRKLEIHGNKN